MWDSTQTQVTYVTDEASGTAQRKDEPIPEPEFETRPNPLNIFKLNKEWDELQQQSGL